MTTTIIAAFSDFTFHLVNADIDDVARAPSDRDDTLTAADLDALTDVVSYPIIGWRIDDDAEVSPEPITPAYEDCLEECTEEFQKCNRAFRMAFIELPDGRLPPQQPTSRKPGLGQ